jgi:hypothetical protein
MEQFSGSLTNSKIIFIPKKKTGACMMTCYDQIYVHNLTGPYNERRELNVKFSSEHPFCCIRETKFRFIQYSSLKNSVILHISLYY